MRSFLLTFALLILAGCGTSSASSPTAAPSHTANVSKPAPLAAQRFREPPPMTINVRHRYTATVATTDGTFTIALFAQLAPVTVNNFVFLARHHYFDNNPFHRIIRDFMIQTGDPTGTGFGGPGYEFKDEIQKGMRYTPGTVAMANLSHPNTNGSQFFIVTGPQGLSLTPSFTIFGRVIKGMKVVQQIANTPVTNNVGTGEPSQPLIKISIIRVTIH